MESKSVRRSLVSRGAEPDFLPLLPAGDFNVAHLLPYQTLARFCKKILPLSLNRLVPRFRWGRLVQNNRLLAALQASGLSSSVETGSR
jgi:hypothetical protein